MLTKGYAKLKSYFFKTFNQINAEIIKNKELSQQKGFRNSSFKVLKRKESAPVCWSAIFKKTWENARKKL